MVSLWRWSAGLAVLAFRGIGQAAYQGGSPVISCDSIPEPTVPGAEILLMTRDLRLEWKGLVYDPSTGNFTLSPPLSVCTVNVTLTHPGAGDEVNVWVWLPTNGWNGRFQGVGGGGWQAGTYGFSSLGLSALQGYAAASTDGSNLFRQDGLDQAFLHELAVVGKAVTASFYGASSFRSYWNGCSQGGRQGFMIAQRYPDDFDGIMANAPALSWPNLALALAWGRHVLRVLDWRPSMCVMQAFKLRSTEACDALDGVKDGVISDPSACRFDPTDLVGQKVDCGLEGKKKVTRKDAQVAAMIRAGPKSTEGISLWDGYDWGTDYIGLLPAELSGVPDSIDLLTAVWIQYFLEKDPDFDLSHLTTVEQFTDLFASAYGEWGGLIGTDLPDLSRFRDAGGKLMSWHGTADELIPANNSIRYRKQVEGVMGGGGLVDDFYKFYVAPGAGHCSGGPGAHPQDFMKKLEAWVEENERPDVLGGKMKNLEGKDVERIICPFPSLARYDGTSDPDKASSYECEKSY
ncbi:related to feruloyl esterase B precursor [Cephalotrichum gorgonifer]|uniref:Carboxylic ester hydrolase n=1 Tax=Cephalotrichum gorgonifer TaxID=2041049 RepID=A0AAE8SYS1_9PEZI|nr:related to feruloyl esterase B precursor [Cephalotrichum gorgonifer]